jgi:hypothetical protein
MSLVCMLIAVNESKLMSGHISVKAVKHSERRVILQHPKRQKHGREIIW